MVGEEEEEFMAPLCSETVWEGEVKLVIIGPFETSAQGIRGMKPMAWRGGEARGRGNTHA